MSTDSYYLFTNHSSGTMQGIIRGDKLVFYNNTFTSTTGCDVCTITAPTGVTASLSGSTATLSWSAVTGATKYYIYRYASAASVSSPSSGSAVLVDSVTTTTYTKSGLTDNYYYYYWVKAKGNCTSGFSSSASVNTICSLSAPTGVSATANGTRANVSWNTVRGSQITLDGNATKYYIYRVTYSSSTSTPSSSSAVLIDSVSAIMSASSQNGLYPMANGYNYYYVRAKGGVNSCTSGFSMDRFFMVKCFNCKK